MPAPEIPGFYFDAEKKRYFKIESNSTAPGAAWSADNVKRRKIAEEEAAVAYERAKDRIVRAEVLNNPLSGGFLAREHGVPQKDFHEACFATGLVDKGAIPLANARWGGHGFNINALCIAGEDWRTGLGVGFASADGQHLLSTYIPRDKNGYIHRQLLAEYRTPGNHVRPYQELHISQVTDIKFHSRIGAVIVAHHSLTEGASLRTLELDYDEESKDPMVPYWNLGVHQGRQRTGAFQAEGRTPYLANAVAPSPSGPETLCAVATAQGLMEYTARDGLHWISLRSAAQKRNQTKNPYRDLFALAYQEGNENIIMTGGRPQVCYLFDKRFNPRDAPASLYFQHPGSITHIKSLNDYHVLVSGIRNTMRTYDLRKVTQSFHNTESAPRRGVLKPGDALVSFPEYKNAAHLSHGLDVDVETGIVAAGHDDGAIAIHSLRSGRQLHCPYAANPKSSVVQALQFQTMVGDDTASLFAGIGSNIQAWSFGVQDL